MEPVDGYIEVGGTTETYDVVDNVEIVIELQKREGSSWKTIKTWSEHKSNDYIVSIAKTYKVEKGYYYRIVSCHYAENEGSHENVYAYSKKLYID
ncbi:MAG: hypothetical protein HPY70_05000 [Firmicutes bacterium]|nr:hypothetical protein [Bacillota bacterium]